jgi:hypothetical protein
MENKKAVVFKYCTNPECLWRGETDADECPKCGCPLRVGK